MKSKRMGKTLIRRAQRLCLALLVAVSCAVPALAAVPSGLSRNLALQIQCLPNGDAAEGMRFQLYYIASVSADGSISVVEPYTAAGVTAETLSDATYRAEALEALAAFINGGGAEADYTGLTGSGGAVVIENLADGIYLCASNTRYVLDGGRGAAYTPVPFLFRLNAELVANRVRVSADTITAVTKFSVSNGSGGSGGGGGNPPVNPPADPPVDPPVEDGGGGETGPVDPDGPVYPPTDPANPDSPDVPDDLLEIDDGDVPLSDEPVIEEIPDEMVPLADFPPEPEDDGDLLDIEDEDVPLAMLPQTGLLWWPVPVMAVLGMSLFLLGWKKYRSVRRNGQEKRSA